MHYFKPVSYEIWTRLSVGQIAGAVEDVCRSWTWKIKRDPPTRDAEGRTIHSIIVRKRRDLQSLEVEVREATEGSLTLVIVHPRFLHGFRVGPPVYVLQGPIKKKVEHVVRAIQRLDPSCQVSTFHHQSD